MRRKLLLLAVGLLLSTSCTTTFTNMTPTRALDPLDFEVSARAQASLHGNVITKAIDGGDAAKDAVLNGTDELTEEQLRDFLDAGLAWFLFKPGVSNELSARIGGWDLLEGMDFGLRYDFTTIKGDWKLQYWESPGGNVAFSSIIGVGKQTVPVPGIVEWLTLSEWSRTDVDFQLSLGAELPDILHAYINPRVLVSKVSVEHKLSSKIVDRIPDDIRQKYDPNLLFKNETMVYWGATAGVMAGYKYVFLAAELTVMKLNFHPTVLGQERNFNSLLVSPSLGLVVTW